MRSIAARLKFLVVSQTQTHARLDCVAATTNMSYDNLTKILAEKYPERFATWLLGTPQTNVEILKTELSIEPIRADSLTFLKTHSRILHLEFQTRWISEPPINFRMLDYWVRLYRLYRLPITQVVILLLPPSEDTEIETTFEFEQTRHQYRVVKIWEEDPSLFLADPVLLPFAPLTAQPTEELLMQVATEVGKMEPDARRQEVASYGRFKVRQNPSQKIISGGYYERISNLSRDL